MTEPKSLASPLQRPGRDFGVERKPSLRAVPDDQVMFHETFEDGFPGTRWETRYSGVAVTWGDVECRSHFGSRAAWCAGSGWTSDCFLIPEEMDASMLNTQRIAFADYTDEALEYWVWHDISTPQDFLAVYLVSGRTTSPSPKDTFHLIDLHTDEWQTEWHKRSVSLVGFPDVDSSGYLLQYGLSFRYKSICCDPVEGAYVDDVLLYGCPKLDPVPLSSPADGADLCSGSGQWFCWQGEDGASSYLVQWSDDEQFPYAVEATASGTCYHSTLGGTGELYWHVRPDNSCRVGSWSKTRSVQLHSTLPAATPIGPRDGNPVCAGALQRYSWEPMTGATSYTVQWDSSTAYASPIQIASSEPSAAQVLFGTGSQYWRISADNPGCEGEWSLNSRIELITCLFADYFESGDTTAWSATVD